MHQRPHLVDPKCNTPLPHLVDNKCITHFGLVVMGFVFGFYITGNSYMLYSKHIETFEWKCQQ